MGSKRSSSKNPNKVPSSPPPAAPPDDENHKNPKKPNLASSSKSCKKQRLSAPMTPGKSPLSPIPSTEGEKPSHNSNHNDKEVPDNSNEISPTDASGNRPSSLRWWESHSLKFLNALLAFKSKSGSLPKPSSMADFLTEINSWSPFQLSEKNVDSKIRHLRFKFHKMPKLGSDSSEFDRTFYEVGTQVFGPVSLKVKGSATGSLNDDTLKENGILEKKSNMKRKKEEPSNMLSEEKQDVDEKKGDDDGVEEEENESEDDEGSDEKADKSMEVENGEEHKKEDLLDGEDNGLLDRDVSGYPFQYLKFALEEYWILTKLNMNILYTALPYVDLVTAKHLDQQFLEVFERMLKLKMEKNKMSNNVIGASLGH